MPPSAAPLSMKMGFPSIGGVSGWVVPDGKDPPPKADAFYPAREGIFTGVSHAAWGGATAHENETCAKLKLAEASQTDR